MLDRDQQIHDVLIKAGEDVQQGMWCMGSWFAQDEDSINNDEGLTWAPEEIFDLNMSVETLQKLHRCAEGSILLATRIAGLDLKVYEKAVEAVDGHLRTICDDCELTSRYGDVVLHEHNDMHMKGMTPFDAGQHLSEIFRDAAHRML